jgi:hypothetical protein
MNALSCIVLLAVVSATGYEPDDRVEYIQRLLDAVKATDRTKLTNTRNYIHVVDRNQCRSAYTDLRTSCLLEAAKRNCYQRRGRRKARQKCRLVTDVIVTNKLGEKELIDTQTKYRIMSATKEYRLELRKELWRRYAELAAEFSLSRFYSEKDDELAAGIDGYCLQSVDRRGLSWQYCVAALVWFVGTSENPID